MITQDVINLKIFSDESLEMFKRLLDIAEKYFSYDGFGDILNSTLKDRFLEDVGKYNFQKKAHVTKQLLSMKISVSDVNFVFAMHDERQSVIRNFYEYRDEGWREGQTISFETILFDMSNYFIRKSFETLNRLYYYATQSEPKDKKEKYSKPTSRRISYVINYDNSSPSINTTLYVYRLYPYKEYVNKLLKIFVEERYYNRTFRIQSSHGIFKLHACNLIQDDMEEDFEFYDDRLTVRFQDFELINEFYFYVLCSSLGLMTYTAGGANCIDYNTEFMFRDKSTELELTKMYSFCQKREIPVRVEKNNILEPHKWYYSTKKERDKNAPNKNN